jgi:ParB-like chromosome segregation protein Spo0J
LRGLAASLGSEADPQLAGPPVVEAMGPNDYRILAGERRIRAARLAGWQKMACLVRPRLDPAQAHTLRLVENLHREELHPLDKAAALKIAWYTANADAMELQAQARAILEIEQSPAATLAGLEELLKAHDFPVTRPPVPWDAVLDRLGLEMEPTRRKRLLRVLGIESEVQARVREIDMSEAALRSLGQLEAADQEKLVTAIEADPELAQKVRRIARVVNQQDYALDEAVAEAQGQVSLDDDAADEPDPETSPEADRAGIDEELLMDTVLALMEMAEQWEQIVTTLNELAQGAAWQDLPEPWGSYAQEAYEQIKTEIEKGAHDVV